MELELRPYQQQLVTSAAETLAGGHRKIVCQLPTGGGKTVCFAAITDRYIRRSQGRVLILVHRIELLKQARRSLDKFFKLPSHAIKAGTRWIPDVPAYVGMIESAHRRIAKLPPIGLVIIDEAHLNTFAKIHANFPDALFIGFTATPVSANKKKPMKSLYSEIVTGPQISQLISEGALCQNITISPKEVVNRAELAIKNGEFDMEGMARTYKQPKYVKSCVEAYKKNGVHPDGTWMKALIFNVNVEHSKMVTEAFRAAGFPAEHLDGTETPYRRAEVLRWFAETPGAVLNNCAVLTCLSEDTEILTKDGWVGMNEITESHNVAQFDEGQISFDFPRKIIKNENFNEDFVELDGKMSGFMVTHNHTMLYRKSYWTTRFRKCKASELIDKDVRIPVSGLCEPDIFIIEQETITDEKRFVSANSYNYRKRGMSWDESIALAKKQYKRKVSHRYANPHELTLDECRFIGFWLGDGTKYKSKSGGYRYAICQTTHTGVHLWIERIMNRIGIDYTFKEYETRSEKIIGRMCSCHRYRQYALSKGTGGNKQERSDELYRLKPYLKKEGTRELKGLNGEQFYALMEGLFKADGLHGNNNKYSGQGIVSEYKELVDLLQEIGVCRGYRVIVSKIKMRPQNKRQLWKISARYIGLAQLVRIRPKLVKNSDPKKVWCVTMPKGTIVTRRNGKVAIMGNCGFDEPSTEMVIVNRATMSMPLWLQITGRGSRPTEFKSMFKILDLGGNAITHGDWNADRDWAHLFHNPKKPRTRDQVAPCKSCPECDAIIPAGVRKCPYCGYDYPSAEEELEAELGEFVVVTRGINVEALMAENANRKKYYTFYNLGRRIAAQLLKQIGKKGLTDERAEFALQEYFKLAQEWCHKNGKTWNRWHGEQARETLYAEFAEKFGWVRPEMRPREPEPESLPFKEQEPRRLPPPAVEKPRRQFELFPTTLKTLQKISSLS